MLRRLFTFASALSLILCAATVVMWMRSYRQKDSLMFQRRDGLWEVAFRDGRLWWDNEPEREWRREPLRQTILRQEALEQQYSKQSLRERQLGDQWQQRSDRFEKCKDGLVSQWVEARVAATKTRDRIWAMHYLIERLSRRPLPAPLGRSLPCGVAIAAMALLPGIWVMRAIASWRRRVLCRTRNLCPHCGYDLRATPDRCPECGRAVATETASRSYTS